MSCCSGVNGFLGFGGWREAEVGEGGMRGGCGGWCGGGGGGGGSGECEEEGEEMGWDDEEVDECLRLVRRRLRLHGFQVDDDDGRRSKRRGATAAAMVSKSCVPSPFPFLGEVVLRVVLVGLFKNEVYRQ